MRRACRIFRSKFWGGLVNLGDWGGWGRENEGNALCALVVVFLLFLLGGFFKNRKAVLRHLADESCV